MRKLLLLMIVAATFTACDVYVVEPVYDPRDQVVGTYDVNEYSETYQDNLRYTITIRRSSAYQDEVVIDNFYAADIAIRAIVDFDRISIPHQIVNGYEVQGAGTVNGDRISLTYSVTDLYECHCTDYLRASAVLW